MIFFGDVSCRSADATFDSDYYLTRISHQDGGLPKVRVSPTSALRHKRSFRNHHYANPNLDSVGWRETRRVQSSRSGKLEC